MTSIHIPEIGEVKIVRHKRLKRLSISVNKNRTVKLNIPYRISLNEGQRFLFEKLEWIKKNLDEIGDTKEFRIDYNFKLNTHSKILSIVPSELQNFRLEINEKEIIISCPNIFEISSPQVQEVLKSIIIKALRREAQQYLPQRAATLANEFNLKYKVVKVRNSRTRWGSCSFTNNINLSLHLILLPNHLIDYVILHELTHTIHKNHGKFFWEYLGKISEDARLKSKELRRYKLNPFF